MRSALPCWRHASIVFCFQSIDVCSPWPSYGMSLYWAQDTAQERSHLTHIWCLRRVYPFFFKVHRPTHVVHTCSTLMGNRGFQTHVLWSIMHPSTLQGSVLLLHWLRLPLNNPAVVAQLSRCGSDGATRWALHQSLCPSGRSELAARCLVARGSANPGW